jgi:hypothetical protein
MMELILTMDAYQCDDGQGNGCGCLFDSLIVERVGKLCWHCAQDLPEDAGC